MSSLSKGVIAAVVLVGLMATISIIGVGMGIITMPWHTVTAQVDSGHEIIDKTYEADNAINNYEWFKNQYEDIKATENKITNTKAQMDSYFTTYGDNASSWDYQTKVSYNQLQTTYLGQKSYYEDQVAEYNARSKMANRNIFKDGLPMNVDVMLW